MTTPDLFGDDRRPPLRALPPPVVVDLFSAAAEAAALASGRPKSQERAEILAPSGPTALAASALVPVDDRPHLIALDGFHSTRRTNVDRCGRPQFHKPESGMKIIAWNVNHQAGKRAIRDNMIPALTKSFPTAAISLCLPNMSRELVTNRFARR